MKLFLKWNNIYMKIKQFGLIKQLRRFLMFFYFFLNKLKIVFILKKKKFAKYAHDYTYLD